MSEIKIRFSDPVRYTIRVAGKMPPGVIEILSNFFRGEFKCTHKDNITQIVGLVKDQIALSGFLNYLCDLHYVLISVKMHEFIDVNKTKE